MNMLIVDDQSYVVQGIRAGVHWDRLPVDEIYEAFSGGQAIEIIRDHTIDVVVSDIEMPYISGLDLAAWITEHHPDIAVIFLTAHADFSYAQKAISLGCYDYLVQPLDYAKLEKSLEKVMEKVIKQHTQKDIYAKGIKWNTMTGELQENFWRKMLFNREFTSFIRIEEESRKVELKLQWETKYQIILIGLLSQTQSLFGWREEHTNQELDCLMQSCINTLLPVACRLALDEVTTVYVIKVPGRNAVDSVVEYGGNGSDLTDVLQNFIRDADQKCQCRVACFVSEAVEITELYNQMRATEQLRVRNASAGAGVYTWMPPEDVPADDTIARIKAYIADHLNSELTRQEIADCVFMSKDYISHLFKQKEGINLVDYINAQKIELAKKLLTETDIPVTLIAKKVGIPNYSYFCKIFKKQTGMAASDFRDRLGYM